MSKKPVWFVPITQTCVYAYSVYMYALYIYIYTYRYRYIYEYIPIMQHLQWSHAVSCSHPQGLKTYDATFPVFFKFVMSQGWKPGGPTFSKISLLTRPGVWKPRDWDFDKKITLPSLHGLNSWTQGFAQTTPVVKRVALAAPGSNPGTPNPYI